MSVESWIGKPIKRLEDKRLLTGTGSYVDDIKIPNMHFAAVLRSPYAHALIKSIDASRALEVTGVVGIITGEDILKMSNPFPVAISAPQKYYSMATKKVRFVGEPVAVVVAIDKATAEDALELISVDYEALQPVVDPEKALSPEAPVLHEEVGSNAVWHRNLNYGEPDRAFAEADFTIKERFVFPKYSSTPMETYAVIASFDNSDEVLTIWSNFHGPWTMFSVAARGLKMPEQKLRLIVPPDIGGGFGIKSSAYPYLVLMGLASMKTGVPVKWIEDRREHLMASSSGTDRISYVEAEVQ
ncbi:MAG: xanthine dehydrogenase family protein molybdopterin-binding subunit, partial [Nitrososphaerales archaeon]